MSDFSKVTGNGSVETNAQFLRTEVARLSAQVNALNNELMVRSAPRLPELIDALSQLTAMAAQGHLPAKANLSQFFAVLDRAREASSTLAIVRNGP